MCSTQALEPDDAQPPVPREARLPHRPHHLGGERRLATRYGATESDAARATCHGERVAHGWQMMGLLMDMMGFMMEMMGFMMELMGLTPWVFIRWVFAWGK